MRVVVICRKPDGDLVWVPVDDFMIDSVKRHARDDNMPVVAVVKVKDDRK